MVNLIRKLLRGEVSLPRTFWLFGALGTAGIIFVFYAWDIIQLLLVIVRPPENVFRRMYISTALNVLVTIAFLAILTLSIWRSARRYEGPRSWTVLAKLGVLIFALILLSNTAARVYVGGIIALGDDSKDIADPNRNSLNASKSLKRDDRFPYTGFWQVKCDPSNVGITIEGERRLFKKPYRLEFCGEQGCGLRGYGKIVEDPEFHIIDNNTIEFEPSRALVSPVIYHRCG
jgi:hypothetical protein